MITDVANSYCKANGRKLRGGFAAIPHALLNSEKYTKLTPKAVKLMVDFLGQYRGYNNGDFSMAWSVMSEFGWRSKSTLYSARDELREVGFITLTRQGGKHQCSLYAVTWQPIDECGGKLDVPSTVVASGEWKDDGFLCAPIRGIKEKSSYDNQ